MAVYFARQTRTQGPVKIGFSRAVSNRLRLLAHDCGFPVELVASIEGSRALEFQFHARFEASHLGREWFAWSADLQAVMKSIAAGEFDSAALPPGKRVTHPANRDLSFLTPGYCYTRSVESRVNALHRRGLPFSEDIKLDLRDATDEQIEAAKAHCEPIIAAWRARYPTRADRYRSVA
jgi:hypothetical protein